MKKITYKLTLRFALSVLACLFLCVGGAWAQDPNGPHTVTLNTNSGAFIHGESETIEIEQGQAFGHLPVPERRNFTFAGWYSIPGHEETRIKPTTTYDYATHHEMLHARWVNKQQTIELVFIGLDGKTEVGRVSIANDGGSLPDISALTYKNNLNVADNKYFAGYYTRINGEGERIYSGVESYDPLLKENELRPIIDRANPFTQTTYLYAFQTHVKHTVYWDYSYDASASQGQSAWKNISTTDPNRIKYGKLTFMNNAGTTLKTIYFDAHDVDDKAENTIGTAFNTHTTTMGQFHLQLESDGHPATVDGDVVYGSYDPSVKGDAGIWNVYFTDEQLSQFTQYNFEPIAWDGASGEKTNDKDWIRTTDKDNHNTIFSFIGGSADNVATLNWTVKLEGLRVYPNVVVAKPLFKNGEGYWEEISQLAHVEGIRCERTGGDGTSFVEYSGSYPVWKLAANGESYLNAIGMTAFEIQGQTVYLNQTSKGSVNFDFNSATSKVDSDQKTSVWHKEAEPPYFDVIFYTIQADEIPVVHFVADPQKNEKLAPTTPVYEFGTQGQVVPNFGTKYSASRPGYTFLGWIDEDKEPGVLYGPTTTFTFSGARTFYPKWQDNEAPVITDPEKNAFCEETVRVHVTDNTKLETTLTQVLKTEDDGEATDVTQELLNNHKITYTSGETNATIILDKPSKVIGQIITWVYTVSVSDGTNTTQKTVTIYSEHAWSDWMPAKDPTDTEPGYTEEYHVCSHCGKVEFRDGGEIIPAAVVLVKTRDGGPETTRAWHEEVNHAVALVTAEQTYLKMTADANVERSMIDLPVVNATLDLNGKSLLVDGEPGNIKGNAGKATTVTILLKDDGNLEYTNRSTVTGTPIRYVRNFNTDTRAGNWQALYLPIAVSNSELPGECTFGRVSEVSTTTGAVNIGVTENVTDIEAKQPYFVKSNDATVTIDLANSTLEPYSTPEEVVIDDTHSFKGSLTNSDNVATVNKAYWVLTNGGSFTWSKADNSQRPYHWVIYDKNNQSAKPNYTLSLYTVGEDSNDATGINSVEANDGNNAIYTIDGMKVDAKAKLAPGIYVKNGKKVVINK